MRRAVLSLPSKPWKKVKIEALGGPRFRIVLLTDLPDEAAFLKVIGEDLRPSLGAGDALEAARVLMPNGRLAVADIVAVSPLPPRMLADLALRTGCVAGATPCTPSPARFARRASQP